jgi:hypothetical protein
MPPLPDPFVGLQLGRVGGLGLEGEPPGRSTADHVDRSAARLGRSVMEHQQPLATVITPQTAPQARKCCRAQGGTDGMVGLACQGRDRPVYVS